MILVIILFSIFSLIYFISKVCIQFSYMNNINLQYGMDVTKLYSDEEDKFILSKVDYIIREVAMVLYKVSHNKFK
ncbi:MAG: hypothetical protein ACRDA3_00535 [Peptostreptococcaceae bacterium]